MPQPCKVCSHPQHQDINRELLRGEQPLAALARRLRLSEDSLARHRANHLVQAVAPLPEPQRVRREEAGDSDLLEQVQDLQSKTLEILQQAEQVGNQRTMLLAVEQSRRNLELQAKLLGPEPEFASPAAIWRSGFPEALESRARNSRRRL